MPSVVVACVMQGSAACRCATGCRRPLWPGACRARPSGRRTGRRAGRRSGCTIGVDLRRCAGRPGRPSVSPAASVSPGGRRNTTTPARGAVMGSEPASGVGRHCAAGSAGAEVRRTHAGKEIDQRLRVAPGQRVAGVASRRAVPPSRRSRPAEPDAGQLLREAQPGPAAGLVEGRSPESSASSTACAPRAAPSSAAPAARPGPRARTACITASPSQCRSSTRSASSARPQQRCASDLLGRVAPAACSSAARQRGADGRRVVRASAPSDRARLPARPRKVGKATVEVAAVAQVEAALVLSPAPAAPDRSGWRRAPARPRRGCGPGAPGLAAAGAAAAPPASPAPRRRAARPGCRPWGRAPGVPKRSTVRCARMPGAPASESSAWCSAAVRRRLSAAAGCGCRRAGGAGSAARAAGSRRRA